MNIAFREGFLFFSKQKIQINWKLVEISAHSIKVHSGGIFLNLTCSESSKTISQLVAIIYLYTHYRFDEIANSFIVIGQQYITK